MLLQALIFIFAMLPSVVAPTALRYGSIAAPTLGSLEDACKAVLTELIDVKLFADDVLAEMYPQVYALGLLTAFVTYAPPSGVVSRDVKSVDTKKRKISNLTDATLGFDTDTLSGVVSRCLKKVGDKKRKLSNVTEATLGNNSATDTPSGVVSRIVKNVGDKRRKLFKLLVPFSKESSDTGTPAEVNSPSVHRGADEPSIGELTSFPCGSMFVVERLVGNKVTKVTSPSGERCKRAVNLVGASADKQQISVCSVVKKVLASQMGKVLASQIEEELENPDARKPPGDGSPEAKLGTELLDFGSELGQHPTWKTHQLNVWKELYFGK